MFCDMNIFLHKLEKIKIDEIQTIAGYYRVSLLIVEILSIVTLVILLIILRRSFKINKSTNFDLLRFKEDQIPIHINTSDPYQ